MTTPKNEIEAFQMLGQVTAAMWDGAYQSLLKAGHSERIALTGAASVVDRMAANALAQLSQVLGQALTEKLSDSFQSQLAKIVEQHTRNSPGN